MQRNQPIKIERQVDPVLHRQKCAACGYYTIYSAVPAGDKALDTCTHCGHQVELAWYPDLKAAFKNMEKWFRDMSEVFPELAELKNPGDHIMLED